MMKLLVFCAFLGLSLAQDKNLAELLTDLGNTKLVELIETTGLTDAFTGETKYTVFAPTNAAFEALGDSVTVTADMLKYHVIAGEVMAADVKNDVLVDTINDPVKKLRTNVYTVDDATVVTAQGSKVTKADQKASNGVIHVVDKVLVEPTMTIKGYVTSAGATDFTILKDLLVAAELADTFDEAGPFTVFAPRNAAFEGINTTALEQDKDALQTLLLNHVVDGTVYSAAVANNVELTAKGGNTIRAAVDGATVKFNEATLVTADVSETNGVIHVIDKVMQEKVGPIGGASTLSATFLTLSLAVLALFLRY